MMDQLSKLSDYYSVGNDWMENVSMNKHINQHIDIKNSDNNGDHQDNVKNINDDQIFKDIHTKHVNDIETIGRRNGASSPTQVRAETGIKTQTVIWVGTGVRADTVGNFEDREQILKLLIRYTDDSYHHNTSDLPKGGQSEDTHDRSHRNVMDYGNEDERDVLPSDHRYFSRSFIFSVIMSVLDLVCVFLRETIQRIPML
jgi:hypothetical protein